MCSSGAVGKLHYCICYRRAERLCTGSCRLRCQGTGRCRATASPSTPTSTIPGLSPPRLCQRRTPQAATAAPLTCLRAGNTTGTPLTGGHQILGSALCAIPESCLHGHLPEGLLWAFRRRVFLQFDGVNNAFYVWMNGQPVGYSQDSCLPAEFDVTRFLQPGRNLVSVQASLVPPSSARPCVPNVKMIMEYVIMTY